MELVWEDDLTSYVTDENENGGTAATPSGTTCEQVHGESQKTIAELVKLAMAATITGGEER